MDNGDGCSVPLHTCRSFHEVPRAWEDLGLGSTHSLGFRCGYFRQQASCSDRVFCSRFLVGPSGFPLHRRMEFCGEKFSLPALRPDWASTSWTYPCPHSALGRICCAETGCGELSSGKEKKYWWGYFRSKKSHRQDILRIPNSSCLLIFLIVQFELVKGFMVTEMFLNVFSILKTRLWKKSKWAEIIMSHGTYDPIITCGQYLWHFPFLEDWEEKKEGEVLNASSSSFRCLLNDILLVFQSVFEILLTTQNILGC